MSGGGILVTALISGALLICLCAYRADRYPSVIWKWTLSICSVRLFWLILSTPWRVESALWGCGALLSGTAVLSIARLLYLRNGRRVMAAGGGTLRLTAIGIIVLIGFRNILYAREFGDETEKYMLGFFATNGLGLYRDVFSHHSPLLPLICHVFYNLFPINELPFARIYGVLLWLLPLPAIAGTRWLSDSTTRYWSGAIYLLLAIQLYWLIDLGIMLYQPIGGILVGCAAILLLPLYADQREKMPGRTAFFWAGAALGAATAIAISFAPAATALAFFATIGLFCRDGGEIRDGIRRLLWFIAGGVAVLIMVAIYLSVFGSLSGYWEEHILFNFKFYTKYGAGFHPNRLLDHLTQLPEQRVHSIHFFSWLLFLASTGILIALGNWRISSTTSRIRKATLLTILAGAFLLCAPRSMVAPHGSGALLFASFFFASIAGEARMSIRLTFALAAIGLALLGHLPLLRAGLPEKRQQMPDVNHFAMRLIKPDERGLFYHWDFYFYFRNGILPGSNHTFFSPWQADYLNAKGVDLCDEIAQKRPVLIRKDRNLSIGPYHWLQFGANVDAFVENHYLPLDDFWFIRPDAAEANKKLLAEFGYFPGLTPRQFAPDKPSIPLGELEQDNPARAQLPPPSASTPPLAMKIRLATYRRQPADLSGTLTVTVKDAQDNVLGSRIVPLQRLQDNSWHSIPLSGKAHPATLDLLCSARSGHGITVWTINAPEYAGMTSGTKTPKGFLIEHILLY